MAFFERHVLDELAAFDDGQLNADRAARVRAHLARCRACAAALQDVRRGRLLLESLPAVTMPADEAARLEALLRQPPRAGRWPARRRLAAAALVALAAGTVAIRFVLGGGPELVVASQPMGLDAAAGDLHEGLRAGTVQLDLASSDTAQVREWLMARAAPEAPLVAHAAAGARPAIRVRGASIVTADGARASLVAYEVDGAAVSLVTARESDVPSAPRSARHSKRVYFRRNAYGHPTLTWSTGGQTYAIVSDLPGAGEQACLACHAGPRFKEALEQEVQRVFDAPG